MNMLDLIDRIDRIIFTRLTGESDQDAQTRGYPYGDRMRCMYVMQGRGEITTTSVDMPCNGWAAWGK